MQIEIKTTKTFENLLNSTYRVSHHIGGTRSGKSYAILQFLIVKCLEEKIDVTVVRKTIPSLKRTIIKDIIDIMKSLNIFNEKNYNITDRIYTFNNGSIIQFISTDDPEKLRGVKSTILFIDEASEVDEESYFQLSIRTERNIILAYNPTISPFHWLRQMQDCERYFTTYRDNPFLEDTIIKGIEDLKNKNEKYWKIYGLGEYASSDRVIFNFEIIDNIPNDADFICFGMDVGYSQDPTALIKLYKYGNDTIILDELLYRTHMVTNEIITELKKHIKGREEVWCDSAEGRLIEEIYRSGINALPVKKGPGSILFGISVMQNYKILITKKSQNLINEMYSYQWSVDKYGVQTDIPEGGMDHCFIGDTKITTNKGFNNISNIKEGDLILTRNGFKRVLKIFNNGYKKVNEYKLVFNNETIKIIGTPEHKIKTLKGWKQLQNLTKMDVLLRHKYSMVKNIDYNQMKDIIISVIKDYTEKYGNITTVKYLKVFIYIILTVIKIIMKYRIFNVLKEKNISVMKLKKEWKKIQNLLKNLMKKVEKQQDYFINQKKENYYIFNLLKKQGSVNFNMKIKYVKNVMKFLLENLNIKNFVQINVKQKIDINLELITKLVFAKIVEMNLLQINIVEQQLVDVKKSNDFIEEVFDLMIEDKHEYFANDILVHNCIDASRYAVMSKLSNKAKGMGNYSFSFI